MSQQIVRYSEAFKMQVISELETGKLASIEEGRRRYGIRGASTIQKWLGKYGKDHLRTRIVNVQTPKDQDQVTVLKRRIKQLEKVLADTQVNAVLNDAYFQIVCDKFGVTDREELKKKAAMKL